MASLFSQELKLFFTSPLFISLELVSVVVIAVLKIVGSIFSDLAVLDKLLPVIWLMLILYSTYFELEIWREWFLNKGIKIKIYTSYSSQTPFLVHSVASLVLLEFKTLVFILPYLSLQYVQMPSLLFFMIATHVNWLLSLSIGSIFSKEAFSKLADSTASFLCVSIFNTIIFFVFNKHLSSPIPLLPLVPWPTPSLENGGVNNLTEPVFLVASVLSIVFYAIAVYVNSNAAKSIRVDGY
ncbi:MAG: hypothetical protein FGF52_00255 [Candidatus Brockarchaeota archaeon]|nr:hypothetical protein [Candidatus Brockarchaeota archaeon]